MAGMDARAELAETLRAVRDLTAALEQHADRLAARHRERYCAFEYSPEALVFTDADDRVLAANLAAEELLRVSRRRMHGRFLPSFFGLQAEVSGQAYETPAGRCWRLRRP